MQARIKKWGNSYAIRLTKKDLAGLGLKEGDAVDIQFGRPRGPVDLSWLPTFPGDLPAGQEPDPRASENHDAHLYGSSEAYP